MEREAKDIKKEIFQLCWYMRGISISEGMNLTWEDRQIIGQIIKENLETTKKTGLNFF
jgi:hypothetical protein